MLERFTKERQRASKGSAFNLEDEDELTHYGQNLSKLDDFDHVGIRLDDSDEDEGQYDSCILYFHSSNRLQVSSTGRRCRSPISEDFRMRKRAKMGRRWVDLHRL